MLRKDGQIEVEVKVTVTVTAEVGMAVAFQLSHQINMSRLAQEM